MSRTYHSFMLRCWRVGAGESRITIEHVQSGEQARVLSLEAAFEWVQHRAAAAPETPRDDGQTGRQPHSSPTAGDPEP